MLFFTFFNSRSHVLNLRSALSRDNKLSKADGQSKCASKSCNHMSDPIAINSVSHQLNYIVISQIVNTNHLYLSSIFLVPYNSSDHTERSAQQHIHITTQCRVSAEQDFLKNENSGGGITPTLVWANIFLSSCLLLPNDAILSTAHCYCVKI